MSDNPLSLSASELGRKRSWQSFAASYALQAVMVAVLVRVAVIAPQIVTPRSYQSVSLYLPVEAPKLAPRAPVRHIQPPPQVTLRRLQPPKITLPKAIEPPVIAKLE